MQYSDLINYYDMYIAKVKPAFHAKTIKAAVLNDSIVNFLLHISKSS